jgi:hypothetical protein
MPKPPAEYEAIASRTSVDTHVSADTAVSIVGDGILNIGAIEPTDADWPRNSNRKLRIDPSLSDVRGECTSLAREAKDAFKEACGAGENDQDQADACYATTLRALEGLWNFAHLRDQPFRDLLAALEAALKYRSIRDFNSDQRNVLCIAFGDLPRWHLDDSQVEEHLSRFVEQDVEVTTPLSFQTGKRLKITIEEVSE